MEARNVEHPNGDVVVSLRAVAVERGGKVVLGPLDLDVPSGRVVGIIGPSGGGKSTLMRTVVGVQDHVRGAVSVLGAPAGVAARRGDVGYVTQDPSVYGDLTVAENLEYFARVLGVDRTHADRAIASVHLDGFEHRRVEKLSGGQRARVSLAVALLDEPPLLVLDEPTVGLDPVLRRDLWSQFRELAAAGCSLIVSSHVMDEATRCDWLVLLRDGQVLATGAPHELLARTATSTIEEAFLSLVGSDR